MISRPTIIFSSIGRTGTNFFAELFNSVCQDCLALHEPDVLTIRKNKALKNTAKQINEIGGKYLWLKIRGSWSLVKISDDRFTGRIDKEFATKKLFEQRSDFIDFKTAGIYIESSIGYYGLLDILGDVFENFCAIYLVRDARTWVQSAYNWGKMYNKKGLKKVFVHNWPRADELFDDPYKNKWPEMGRFARICWAWRYLNEFALNSIEKDSNIKLYKFEDIFTSKVEDSKILDLLDYISNSRNIHIKYNREEVFLFLKNKINASKKGDLFKYNNWTGKQKTIFEDICGPLMDKFGYR